MSIQSMTGYGLCEKSNDSLSVKAEFKSLNGKFLDWQIRLPKWLSGIEMPLRNQFKNGLERGSVTLNLYVQMEDGADAVQKINVNAALQYAKNLKPLQTELNINDHHNLLSDLLKLPGVIQSEDPELGEDSKSFIFDCCNIAYQQLIDFRKKEGAELKTTLSQHLTVLRNLLQEVITIEKGRGPALRERLETKIGQLKEVGQQDRFEQELIFYLERLDITEELKRLSMHLDHFEEVLNTKPKGKVINFVSQEMGREINTMGSKANDAEMQKVVVGMKDELEKIKEQSLNIL